jgi:hypothetical protein
LKAGVRTDWFCDRQRGVISKHLGRTAGERDAPNAEVGQEGAPGAIIVEENNATARRHKCRQFFGFEGAFGVDYDEGVRARKPPKLEGSLHHSPLRSELVLGDANELGQPLPVLTPWIEGPRNVRRRPSRAGANAANAKNRGKRGKGRGGGEDPASHLSCL